MGWGCARDSLRSERGVLRIWGQLTVSFVRCYFTDGNYLTFSLVRSSLANKNYRFFISPDRPMEITVFTLASHKTDGN
jgi:hypothetical protein